MLICFAAAFATSTSGFLIVLPRSFMTVKPSVFNRSSARQPNYTGWRKSERVLI
jgi:hypothetical protein